MTKRILLLLPLCLFAGDALAWGLHTHLYFAQYLAFALPFADPALRAAARRFPRLVLAGACLPDLALAGTAMATPAFRRSHGWPTLRRVIGGPRSDEERAIGLGYASHLLSDIVAHNAFVPEHERRALDLPVLTHAVSEWAMDRHVAASVFAKPGEVLAAERPVLAEFVSLRLRCPAALAKRAIDVLAAADNFLRATPIPRLCLGLARRCDAAFEARLDAYVSETSQRLAQVEHLFEDGEPALEPEPPRGNSGAQWHEGRPLLPARLV